MPARARRRSGGTRARPAAFPPTHPRGPAAAGAFADAPPRRAPLVTADTGLSSLLAGDGEGRDAAAFPEAGFPAGFAAPRNQVTFVNNERRKIMIDGGRNQGFSEGGKLELRRRGQWIGDLLVVEVYDDISACDILRGNIPPEPGDSVRRPDSPSF